VRGGSMICTAWHITNKDSVSIASTAKSGVMPLQIVLPSHLKMVKTGIRKMGVK
jgi:hypothetical protein